MSRYHAAGGRIAGGDGRDIGLLEAFGAGELLPLVQSGRLRLIGGDPDEEWGELELVIEGLGDADPSDGTQYLLKVHRDEDIASEAEEQFGPGEGPHQKYNVETETFAGGSPMGGRWEEGFDDADEAIAWIEAKAGSGPDERGKDAAPDDDACPECGGAAVRTPDGLLACPECGETDRGRLSSAVNSLGTKNASPGGGALALPADAVRLPDNKQWTNRFEVRSETSDRVYTIAQNKAKGHWGCSCPSWRTRRTCKHLKALGLPELEQPAPIAVLEPARGAPEPSPATPEPEKAPQAGALALPHGAIKLPDNQQWTNRFTIKSETSDRVYTIAQNKKKGHWGCSCPSWRTRRTCKHLEALGLPEMEQPAPITVMARRIVGRAGGPRV